MKRSFLLMALAVLPAAHLLAQTPQHGDLLVGFSGSNDGGIYVVDVARGTVKGLLSGRAMKPSWPPDPSRGTGPAISGLPGIVTTRDGRILASAISPSNTGIVQIDPATGNRTLIAAGWPSFYGGAGALCLLDQQTAIAGSINSHFPPASQKLGELYRIDLPTGLATLIGGAGLSDGAAFGYPMSIAARSRAELFLTDFHSFGNFGAALFRADLTNQRHIILTAPFTGPISRYVVTNGAVSATPQQFPAELFGTGPACSDSAYRIGVIGGDLYQIESSFSQGQGSGIIRIDRTTGDRTLILGKALDAQGNILQAPAFSAPPGFGEMDPAAIFESPTGEMLIAEWTPYGRLLAFDLQSRVLRVIVSFNEYFRTSTIQPIRTMAIYTNCPADINLDGVADDADFSRFVGAYDILDCADAAMPAPCPADLNADGAVDDSDFAVFVVGYDKLVCD